MKLLCNKTQTKQNASDCKSHYSAITDKSIAINKKLSDNLSDISTQNAKRFQKGKKRLGILNSFVERNNINCDTMHDEIDKNDDIHDIDILN